MSVRLDKWLHVARVYKTRSLATKACQLSRVTVNGVEVKPHRELQVGDRVEAEVIPGWKRVLVVRELAEKTLAVAGLSRDEKSMSAAVFKELKAKGYTLYAVNPNADSIRGEKCYPGMAALPAVAATYSPVLPAIGAPATSRPGAASTANRKPSTPRTVDVLSCSSSNAIAPNADGGSRPAMGPSRRMRRR